MQKREVAPERTGFRDEEISRRHRIWGVSCPATDLDFVLIEYTHQEPAAIIEYKNEHAQKQFVANAQYQVLIKLGDSSKIPVLAVRYAGDFSKFLVVPLNDYARNFIERRKELSEKEFVRLLYYMRHDKPTKELLDALHG